MIHTLGEVRHLHIELSSQCNARCGRCPRNTFGFPFQMDYVETNLGLDTLKQTFDASFLSHIDEVLVNGNYGDFVMNQDSIEIIRYLRQHIAPYDLDRRVTGIIKISTNGSARNSSFWQDLGALPGVEVHFCLDGLQDTHGRYRQDTDFNLILKNAKDYIKAGGHAVWVFTQFPYNAHQISQAQALSESLGFKKFQLRINDRGEGPIYDRDGNTVWYIGDSNPNDLPVKMTEQLAAERRKIINRRTKSTTITCKALRQKSIYMGASGRITPCCWTDLLQPESDKKMSRDKQLSSLLYRYRVPLKDSDPYFEDLVQSWSGADQPAICQNFCGA